MTKPSQPKTEWFLLWVPFRSKPTAMPDVGIGRKVQYTPIAMTIE